MITAVVKRHLEVVHGVAGEHAALHRLDNALLRRSDEFLRHAAAHNGVDELVIRRAERCDPYLHMAILPMAAGLADEPAFAFGRLAHRFPVRHLRLADIGAHVELALQTVHDDLEM